MEYKIIDYVGLEPDELETEINRLAGEGWIPQFSICNSTCILLARPPKKSWFETAALGHMQFTFDNQG